MAVNYRLSIQAYALRVRTPPIDKLLQSMHRDQGVLHRLCQALSAPHHRQATRPCRASRVRRGPRNLRCSNGDECSASSAGQEADSPNLWGAACPSRETAQLENSASGAPECPDSGSHGLRLKVITTDSRFLVPAVCYIGYLPARCPSLVGP